jgi:acyl carrier protein
MESNNKENIDKKILKIAQIIFKKKKIDIKSTINNIQEWDSLNHLRLMIDLQKKFKIKFELNEIININTLKKWSKLIQKKLKIK